MSNVLKIYCLGTLLIFAFCLHLFHTSAAADSSPTPLGYPSEEETTPSAPPEITPIHSTTPTATAIPGFKKICDDRGTGKCISVPERLLGVACESDIDCKYLKKCHAATTKCLLTGTGRPCADDKECETNRCGEDSLGNPICARGQEGIICDTFADCQIKICHNGKCIFGGNENSLGLLCSSDSDCKRKACDSVSRLCREGAMGVACKNDYDCDKRKTCSVGSSEMECSYAPVLQLLPCEGVDDCLKMRACNSELKCVDVDKVPVDPVFGSCRTDSDCANFPRFCSAGKCLPSILPMGPPCEADNECKGLKQCSWENSGNDFISKCSENGFGPVCKDIDDCVHRGCLDGECRFIPLSGPNTCSSSSQCNHFECVAKNCQKLNWPGTSRCQPGGKCSYKGCFLTHCEEFNGSFEDQCQNDSNCTHKECDFGDCFTAAGPGVDECYGPGDPKCADDPEPVPASTPDTKTLFSLGPEEMLQETIYIPAFSSVPTPIPPTQEMQKYIQQLVPSSRSQRLKPPSPAEVRAVLRNLEGFPRLGAKNAPVSMVAFFDLSCGMCARFIRDSLQKINEHFIKTGKLRLYFVDFPLGRDPKAMKFAEASQCANEQGKYLEYAQYILANIRTVDVERTSDYAQIVGLRIPRFEKCMRTGRTKGVIERGIELGSLLHIDGTPQFFINGTALGGAQAFEKFKAAIENEFPEKESAKSHKELQNY